MFPSPVSATCRPRLPVRLYKNDELVNPSMARAGLGLHAFTPQFLHYMYILAFCASLVVVDCSTTKSLLLTQFPALSEVSPRLLFMSCRHAVLARSHKYRVLYFQHCAIDYMDPLPCPHQSHPAATVLPQYVLPRRRAFFSHAVVFNNLVYYVFHFISLFTGVHQAGIWRQRQVQRRPLPQVW